MNTSLISSLLTPLLSAPRMWSLSSCSLPSAVSMARFSSERVLRGKPGRFQMSFQQWLCRYSLNSRLKSSTLACDFSTQALPSTSVRVFRPSFSRSLFGLESMRPPGKGSDYTIAPSMQYEISAEWVHVKYAESAQFTEVYGFSGTQG